MRTLKRVNHRTQIMSVWVFTIQFFQLLCKSDRFHNTMLEEKKKNVITLSFRGDFCSDNMSKQ